MQGSDACSRTPQRRKNVTGENAAGVESEFSFPLYFGEAPRDRTNFRIRHAEPNNICAQL
jgi:hypothetical protein